MAWARYRGPARERSGPWTPKKWRADIVDIIDGYSGYTRNIKLNNMDVDGCSG